MDIEYDVLDVHTFNYEERKGEVLYCVESVTNDKEEIGIQTYICKNKNDAIKLCEKENEMNKDKRIKFIQVDYIVEEDELMYI